MSGLPAGLIEKDYVNTLILSGVYQHPFTKEMLAFKGGTAIYKLYFPTKWRFSEDLDFTATYGTNGNEVIGIFGEILDKLNEPDPNIFIMHSSHSNPGYVQMKIQYNGPLGGRNTTKIDISLRENVHFPVIKMIYKPQYVDMHDFTLSAYSIEEIMVEKIRALFQRTRVRDLFDVHKLVQVKDFDQKQIREGLKLKSIEKDIELNTASVFNEKIKNELAGYWEKGLGLLTKDLPEYDDVYADVRDYVCELVDGE